MAATLEEIALLREAYNIIDVSGDGLISVDELQKFFSLEGDISRQEAIDAVKVFDTDKSGQISFDEFVNFMVEWRIEERQKRRQRV